MMDIISRRTTKTLIPSNRTLIIHLRTGDVIDRLNAPIRDYLLFDSATEKELNGSWYTRSLPFYDRIWEKIQSEGIEIDDIMLITGWHRKQNHSRSVEHINHVIRHMEEWVDRVTSRINESPDGDFLIMTNSKYFVASGGGFSKVIANLVKKKGGRIFGFDRDGKHNCIVTYEEDTSVWKRVRHYLMHFDEPRKLCLHK